MNRMVATTMSALDHRKALTFSQKKNIRGTHVQEGCAPTHDDLPGELLDSKFVEDATALEIVL